MLSILIMFSLLPQRSTQEIMKIIWFKHTQNQRGHIRNRVDSPCPKTDGGKVGGTLRGSNSRQKSCKWWLIWLQNRHEPLLPVFSWGPNPDLSLWLPHPSGAEDAIAHHWIPLWTLFFCVCLTFKSLIIQTNVAIQTKCRCTMQSHQMFTQIHFLDTCISLYTHVFGLQGCLERH